MPAQVFSQAVEPKQLHLLQVAWSRHTTYVPLAANGSNGRNAVWNKVSDSSKDCDIMWACCYLLAVADSASSSQHAKLCMLAALGCYWCLLLSSTRINSAVRCEAYSA